MTAMRFVILLGAVLALPGCVVLALVEEAVQEDTGLEWSAEDAAAVTRHLVQALMLAYSPETAFRIGGDGALAAALEAHLRESGYAIAAPSGQRSAAPDVLQLTCASGFVSSEAGGPVWVGLGVEGWRVDGLFVRGDDGRLVLSGGLTVRGR